MKIKKHYKFYAGHRNQLLNDKCKNPHGHYYQLFVTFNVTRNGNISTLFNDFDSVIEPYLKQEIDHRFFIDEKDELLKYFEQFEKDTKSNLNLIKLPFASSVENVSFFLFDKLIGFGFEVDKIELQETSSSTIEYTYSDYLSDKQSELGTLLLKFKDEQTNDFF